MKPNDSLKKQFFSCFWFKKHAYVLKIILHHMILDVFRTFQKSKIRMILHANEFLKILETRSIR